MLTPFYISFFQVVRFLKKLYSYSAESLVLNWLVQHYATSRETTNTPHTNLLSVKCSTVLIFDTTIVNERNCHYYGSLSIARSSYPLSIIKDFTVSYTSSDVLLTTGRTRSTLKHNRLPSYSCFSLSPCNYFSCCW